MLYLRGSIYWCQFKLRGRRIRVSTGETDRARARRAERLLKARAENAAGPHGPGGRPASSTGLLRELAGEQLVEVEARKRAPPYIASLRVGWKHLLGHFGASCRPDQVTFDGILDYELARRKLGIRGQSIRRELWQLRHALTSAKRKGWVDQVVEFPGIAVDPPDERRRGKLVEDEVLRALLAALNDDAKDRLVVALSTALRSEELKRLRASWLVQTHGKWRLRIPIGSGKAKKKEEVIACPDEAAKILLRRAKALGELPLFPIASHKTQVNRVCRDLDLSMPVTLRDLRTTFATRAMEEIGDEEAVRAQLRHWSYRQTQAYQRSTIVRLARSADAVAKIIRGGATKKGPQPDRRTA